MKGFPPQTLAARDHAKLEAIRCGSHSTSARRIIARAAIVVLVLTIAGCANAIDVICPPAGQCPNTRSGHGGGY